MENIKFELVTQVNLLLAIAFLCTGFPGQMKEIVQSLDSSTRPREQWTLAGAREHIGEKWKYYIMIVDNKPVGVIGMYTLKNDPIVLWIGWTCVFYLYRRRGYAKKLIQFILNTAEEEGYTMVRAWQTATPQFDPMCNLLKNMGFEVEVFPGQDNTDGYRVFSRGLNDQPTTPCPPDTAMVGGLEDYIQETPLSINIQQMQEEIAQKQRKAREHRQLFKNEFGNVENYINEDNRRLVELTSDIAAQRRNSLTESFEELINIHFPIEAEREIVFGTEGLMLYVQPDNKQIYPPNVRRIWAITDRQSNKAVAGIIYNFVLLPEELRLSDEIQGVLGITYLMVDINYRELKMSRKLIELVLKECAEFIKNTINVDKPQIIKMTEQNDPMSMTLEDALTDLPGACMGLAERQAAWGSLGQRKIEGFNYVQVSLRNGLKGLSLGLHVQMPTQEQNTIPSEVLACCVESYADLALNKQVRDIEEDPDMQSMREQLNFADYFTLNPTIDTFIKEDAEIMAALIQESVGALGDPFTENEWEEKTIGELLQKYRDKVAEYRAPDSI